MYKPDLVLNSLQLLICHETKPNLVLRSSFNVVNDFIKYRKLEKSLQKTFLKISSRLYTQIV